LLRRIADQRLAEFSISDAAIGDDELRYVEYRQHPLADDGGRTAAGGLNGEIVTVALRARDRHEHVAPPNLAEVVRAARRADVARTGGQVGGECLAERNSGGT
jgi:hypothetical protein